MLSGIKFIPRDQLLKPSSSDSELASSEEEEKGSKKKRSKRKKEKRRKKEKKSKRSSKSKKSEYSSDSDPDSSSSESTGNKRRRKKKQEYDGGDDDDDGSAVNRNEREVVRKEMGLEWMLSSGSSGNRKPGKVDSVPEEPQADEVKGANPRELNPYLRDNGSGYPDDTSASVAAAGQLLSSSVVGDGGASWRLKALKRAKEQAAREGWKLDEI